MLLLDDAHSVAKIDASNMRALLSTFDTQCRDAAAGAVPIPAARTYPCICVAGMGGSAIAGDYGKRLVKPDAGCSVIVHRDYGLPSCVREGSLVVALSYSGDTEETVSAYREARKRRCDVWTLSSGGTLEKLAKEDGVSHVKIPPGNPPRCSLGWIFFPLFRLFLGLGLVEAFDAASFFAAVATKVRECASADAKQNPAKMFAWDCFNRNIVVYSGRALAPAACRWKTQVAENSKAFAFCNEFPEMNHNEIMSWTYPEFLAANSTVFFLVDPDDHPRVRVRMELTEKILSDKGVRTRLVGPFAGDALTRLFLATVLGDWMSFYLAILHGVDPTAIPEISLLKRELAKTA